MLQGGCALLSSALLCFFPLHTAHLLSAIDPATGKPLDDHRLKAEISTFMGAGFETTSHAITWCLTMLVSAEAHY
jgi:cytochrome P450